MGSKQSRANQNPFRLAFWISENESEKLLIGKSPFTYLLRSGEKERPYFISFVREDGSIKHQFFALEFDRKGWLYRNGATCPSRNYLKRSG